jgi:hypothetical protein
MREDGAAEIAVVGSVSGVGWRSRPTYVYNVRKVTSNGMKTNWIKSEKCVQ